MRNDYERSRLQLRVSELQAEAEAARGEKAALEVQYRGVLGHNQRMVEQLKELERDSYEIQSRVRRGIEVERENENIAKSVEQQREKERDMARMIVELKGTIR